MLTELSLEILKYVVSENLDVVNKLSELGDQLVKISKKVKNEAGVDDEGSSF